MRVHAWDQRTAEPRSFSLFLIARVEPDAVSQFVALQHRTIARPERAIACRRSPLACGDGAQPRDGLGTELIAKVFPASKTSGGKPWALVEVYCFGCWACQF